MAERVADLTVDELRALIREAVQEVLSELADEVDPDEGLVLKPEIVRYLRSTGREEQCGIPLADVKRELGLDE